MVQDLVFLGQPDVTKDEQQMTPVRGAFAVCSWGTIFIFRILGHLKALFSYRSDEEKRSQRTE